MNLNKRQRVIVAIQIAGSAYGLIILLTSFPGFDSGGIKLSFYSVLLVVSAFGFASGLLFWAGKSIGYFGSIVTHALQIPMIMTTAFAYKLAFGIGVFLKVIGPIKLVSLNLGAPTILVVAPELQGTIIAVNLYAIFALMYLVRDWKKANEQSIQTIT
jgi:hypothetical protein